MSKLNIDQKSVRALFSEKKADFLIPDYQRPYAWGEKECQTLWDDLFLFAFPDNDCDKFNSDSDEYFLGPIVTFKNDDGKMEIIDGQQRLTTLSDADIFKAQFYKYYSAKGEREVFIQKWKDLEVLCDSIFHPITGTPMDELFTRYMYYERAKQGIKSSTTEALRKFYERNAYSLLKNDQTFENLINLADFWNDVQNQNVERFSDRILRRLFVLNYAPNGMWTYFVSVYYMANRDSDGLLNDDRFYSFLNKITAFIWAYAVTNPGVNALRTPIFAEMTNIVTGQPVRFSDYLFDTQKLQNAFDNYTFSNNRAITKAMLTWWAFQNSSQELLSLESVLEIEHIYARNRQEKEHSLSNPRNVESLGNKVLLEKRINIRASDYRFSDKVKYYTGFENNRKQKKEGTKIKELTDLAAKATDFTESDIVERNAKIILSFVTFMRNNDLLCED